MTRNHVIGGTDAATLIGLGKESPVMLYLRLRGEVTDDFEGNEATDAGTLFEDHVAVPLARKRLGMDLVRPQERTMALPTEPRIGASLDFEVAGNRELAEIKLTGSRAMWGEPGTLVPLHVAAQTQFQMAVARARGRAVPCVHVIATFIPGFVMEDFRVPEDRDVGDAMLAKAGEMLRRVDAGEPPEAGSEADARALFLANRGERLVATLEQQALIDQLRIAKRAEKDVEATIKTIRDALLPQLGTATEILAADGEVLATWRANKFFDEAAFCMENPELATQYRRLGVDLTKLRKDHKRTVDLYMREPQMPMVQTRVLRLKGEE